MFAIISVAIALGIAFISIIVSAIVGFPALSYLAVKSSFLTLLTWVSGLLVILLPLVLLLSLLIRLYGPYRLKRKWSSGMTWIWTAAFVVFCGSLAFTAKDFSYYTEIDENSSYPITSDEVNILLGPERNSRVGSIYNFDFDDFFIDDSGLHSNLINVTVHKTSEDKIRVEKNIRSNGSSNRNAKYNASSIQYDIDVEQNTITIPRSYRIKKGDKFRGQFIDIDIYIPEGKTLEVDKKLKWFSFSNFYDRD